MIGYYNVDLRSRKWYKPIVIHLLQIAVYNSYLLFRKTTQKHFSFIKYQESIIRELIAPMRKKKSIQPTPVKKTVIKRSETLKASSEDCQLGKRDKQYCSLCQSRKLNRKQTVYYCKTHEVSICIIPCYDIHRGNCKK